jgi:seryl-tRNA synthetase
VKSCADLNLEAAETALAAIEALCRGETPDPLPDHSAVRAVVELHDQFVHADIADRTARIALHNIERERDAARAEVERLKKQDDDKDSAAEQELDEMRTERDAARAEAARLRSASAQDKDIHAAFAAALVVLALSRKGAA